MRQARVFGLDKFNLIDLETLTRATRRKVLNGERMFKRSFEKSFSVKLTHLESDRFSFLNGFWIKWSFVTERFLGVCFSQLNNQFGLSLFENEIGHQLFANIEQPMALHNPFINPSFMSRVFLKDRPFVLLRTAIEIGKVFIKPIHQFFSRIRDVKNRSVVWRLVSVIFGGSNSINAERSFTINDASKIGQFQRFIYDFSIRNVGHFTSLVARLSTCTLSHIPLFNSTVND